MQLTFKGQGLAVPDPIKAHARRRFTRLDRYLPESTELVLELRREETRAAEQRYIVQATLNDGRRIVRAEERARDLEAAIDAAADKLARQARRYRQRRRQKDRTSFTRSLVSEPANPAVAEIDVSDDDDEAAPISPEDVVRVKRFPMKPMTVEEAIQQADLLGHDFFLFFKADEKTYGLLYKRNDGGYGLILPEVS
ncbi:MAG TPA: ribosome-associated translation inhibitor RaiA [Dehalococcoidia bacterium]|nr:ribosome-associated translation inhibitor RaiA [Dehalococcoidia bacterium]